MQLRTHVPDGVIHMKKRYVLKNKKRFLIFVASVAALILTAVPVMNVYSYRPPEIRTITVKPGDTLWGIAKETGIEGDIRETVYKIKELNKLGSSEIYAGTELIVPVQ